VERLSGGELDSPTRAALMQGPREIDFVNSALQDTMAQSYHQIREHWHSRELPDLRTAAFAIAIERVASSYLALGIFP